jgi:hypothetical protein
LNKLNTNRKAIFIALALIFAGACIFIFERVYEEAKSAAITKLDQQEMIYARQAARGIEEYFATWKCMAGERPVPGGQFGASSARLWPAADGSPALPDLTTHTAGPHRPLWGR